jgi:hypothetical protein
LYYYSTKDRFLWDLNRLNPNVDYVQYIVFYRSDVCHDSHKTVGRAEVSARLKQFMLEGDNALNYVILQTDRTSIAPNEQEIHAVNNLLKC